jgi:Na+-driven multidrug efflux pump
MANLGATTLRLILIAVAINAIYNIIYQHILANGRGRVVLYINIATLIVALPVGIVFSRSHEMYAGGVIWLVISAIQFVLGGAWVVLRNKDLNSIVKI